MTLPNAWSMILLMSLLSSAVQRALPTSALHEVALASYTQSIYRETGRGAITSLTRLTASERSQHAHCRLMANR